MRIVLYFLASVLTIYLCECCDASIIPPSEGYKPTPSIEWTQLEDKQLTGMIQNRISLLNIAKCLGCSVPDVMRRCNYLYEMALGVVSQGGVSHGGVSPGGVSQGEVGAPQNGLQYSLRNRGAPWTKEENEMLLQLFKDFGRQWKKIANILGRSEASVKYHLYSLLREERIRKESKSSDLMLALQPVDMEEKPHYEWEK
jgi:hypothetical protein